jgi:hypothetical protein
MLFYRLLPGTWFIAVFMNRDIQPDKRLGLGIGIC